VAYDGFDDGYGDPSDYGMTQSDFDTATSIGQAVGSGNEDSIAQAIANSIAQPQVGQNRSNVIGTSNYDPQYAAALQISRGLNPGVNTGGLDVPSYLQPQLTGPVASDFRGSFNLEPKYYSPVERFMQTTLSDIAQSGPGIVGLVGRGLDSLFGGIDFLNNSKAGSTIEETVDAFGNVVDPNVTDPLSATGAVDAFGTPVSRAEQTREANLGFGLGSMMTDPSFMGRPTVTKTSLDKLVDRPSIAQLAEDRKKQNALNSIFDMLNKNTQNIEIAAGTNAGKTLNPELPVSFPYGRSGGYNLSVLSSRGDVAKPNPVQGPPSPFFPDQITPTERPFATTDQVALRSSPDGYYFANAFNRPLDATRTSDKYRTPINEEEARAEEFAAYNFSSIPKGTDPIEFINRRDLPSDLQGIVSLNRDLDYGSTIPLSYYFDQTARGKAEERTRLEKIKEAEEALANLPRFYPYSGTAELPLIY